MIIINMKHKKSTEEMIPFVPGHRAFIQEHLGKGNIIMAGPNNSTSGGVLLTQLDAAGADQMMQEDPYIQQNLSSYTLISFAAKVVRNDVAGLKET